MKTVLTIAGSDSSGGAGIQADLKTYMALGVYGMSAVTAITAQNTLGVTRIDPVSPSMIEAQLRAVFEDIPPDAVKIGMLGDEEAVLVTAQILEEFQPAHIVYDPVMASTSGTSLMGESAFARVKDTLLPLTHVITPNLAEAQRLSGLPIRDKRDMARAAEAIGGDYPGAILVKGGHLAGCCDDLLYSQGQITWYPGEVQANPNTHGTGCTLSSAIAAGLAKGLTLREAVRHAKIYITEAIAAGLTIGHGRGPLDHGYRWKVKG
ncbi:bifunctional hydroxymethylpyrimidine kinase/phosphomethylpyrimidine kinase [Bianquea renquensis]|uniref:Hydroxymethylpyrimidine/phosphomethylpyrimidine kinase n=1 Tax=Bianquea renquensis TaxID=2763661 RepID=A0A926I105_9FIRM|nr:bifunctional hydroxymethylpyrimidine kinase/phosphomethylpyrimidine kinase [Bianquea renquensis]MBC8542988.1 bifunctional hydroxymethylpyrimidine kinase/phosphomethylpyrimidine kinase [Bianquea renquensis]